MRTTRDIVEAKAPNLPDDCKRALAYLLRQKRGFRTTGEVQEHALLRIGDRDVRHVLGELRKKGYIWRTHTGRHKTLWKAMRPEEWPKL